jgi:hypothetical protein
MIGSAPPSRERVSSVCDFAPTCDSTIGSTSASTSRTSTAPGRTPRARLDARVVQHVVDQAEQVALRALDAGERLALGVAHGPWIPSR